MHPDAFSLTDYVAFWNQPPNPTVSAEISVVAHSKIMPFRYSQVGVLKTAMDVV